MDGKNVPPSPELLDSVFKSTPRTILDDRIAYFVILSRDEDLLTTYLTLRCSRPSTKTAQLQLLKDSMPNSISSHQFSQWAIACKFLGEDEMPNPTPPPPAWEYVHAIYNTYFGVPFPRTGGVFDAPSAEKLAAWKALPLLQAPSGAPVHPPDEKGGGAIPGGNVAVGVDSTPKTAEDIAAWADAQASHLTPETIVEIKMHASPSTVWRAFSPQDWERSFPLAGQRHYVQLLMRNSGILAVVDITGPAPLDRTRQAEMISNHLGRQARAALEAKDFELVASLSKKLVVLNKMMQQPGSLNDSDC